MSEEQERFNQAEWTAQTVNQTVNNWPYLDRMSVEEKVDLIVRKLVGSNWDNDPGVLPLLRKMEEMHREARAERIEMASRLRRHDIMLESLNKMIWVTSAIAAIEGLGILYLLAQLAIP